MKRIFILLMIIFSIRSWGDNTSFMSSKEAKLIVRGGKRLSLWINLINKTRIKNGEDLILLSKMGEAKGTQTKLSFGVDNPYYYGPKTLKKDLQNILENSSHAINRIIFFKGELKDKLPESLDDDQFIKEARKIKGLYEECLRWKYVEENLSYFGSLKTHDIRSYLRLKKIENLEEKIKKFDLLDDDEKNILAPLLIDICRKTNALYSYCLEELNKNIRESSVTSYFKNYWYLAEYWWNFIMQIPRKNPNIYFDKSTHKFIVKALDPKDKKIRNFIKNNIENEYSLDDYSVEVLFVDDESEAAFSILFEEGVQPHAVNESLIVMNKNESLDEASTKHIIKHEFGHILGFKDCYIEFYDYEREEVVYYEIDQTDLMCSRIGRFNKRMLDVLKYTYIP